MMTQVETRFVKVARVGARMGSFVNVKADDGQVYSCGIGPDLTQPRPGDLIEVAGVIKGGSFHTSDWRPAYERFLVIGREKGAFGGNFGGGDTLEKAESNYRRAGGRVRDIVRRWRFRSAFPFAPPIREAGPSEADAWIDETGACNWIRCDREELT